MHRRLFLLCLPALANCGGEGEAPPPPPKKLRQAAQPPAAPALPTAEQVEAAEQGADAADVLRRYYAHIEAGRYKEAWRMRGGGDGGAEAFARAFAPYERYRVTVGQPSQPVGAAGWSFVEVPVMIYGHVKGGKPFGSAGSVTLHRAAGGPQATVAQKQWHIYTG